MTAAGAANIAMLATIALISVPRPGTTLRTLKVPVKPLTLAPRLATTKATVATKKAVVSFSDMFRRPTTAPNITSNTATQLDAPKPAAAAIPAKTAMTTDTRYAHSPAFVFFIFYTYNS